jgi:hypothetical protein
MVKIKVIATTLLFLFTVLNTSAQTGTITISADSQFIRHSLLFKFLFGNNYRSIWATPVKATVFTFNQAKHQYTPVKTGGGLQTKSLHLADETGNEWVLRSVQKNPANWVSPFWRKTFVKKIVQDQISGSFPYGALIVPVIADALQIDHNTPQLVWIPDDTALHKFRKEFSNRLCFLEERNPKGKTISTEKLLHLKDSLPDVKIDSITYLKCRLMDVIIGDWDRHADQYRWYIAKHGDTIIYKPVPNDRDQVFFSTGGLIPKTILRLGLMRYLEGFNSHIKDINGFMQRGLSLDKKIMAHLSYTDWQRITHDVVDRITDDILYQSLLCLPENIQSYNLELQKKMINRRDSLILVSKEYYKKIHPHKKAST